MSVEINCNPQLQLQEPQLQVVIIFAILTLGETMEKKIDISKKILDVNDIFICPYCKLLLSRNKSSLICQNNHTFDISKKGVVNLINTSNLKTSKIYNKTLFAHRRKFIQKNFYFKIYENISKIINNIEKQKIKILDVGCGEGIHSINILKLLNKKYTFFGIDFSKDAINLASDYCNENIYFFNSDVNNIPIESNSFDVIIDFLSPYNEKEIKRLLVNGGIFIKVSPGTKYLKEYRNYISINDYKKEKEVFENLARHFINISKIECDDEYEITKEEIEDLIFMTPMRSENKIDKQINFNKITINLNIYIVRK